MSVSDERLEELLSQLGVASREGHLIGNMEVYMLAQDLLSLRGYCRGLEYMVDYDRKRAYRDTFNAVLSGIAEKIATNDSVDGVERSIDLARKIAEAVHGKE